MKQYISFWRHFSDISKEHYEKYLVAEKNLEQLLKEIYSGNRFDLETFPILLDEKLKCAFIVITFEAFTIESFTNLYATFYYGEEEFYWLFECRDKQQKEDIKGKRANTIEKLITASTYALKKDVISGKAIYGHIKELFKMRDKLAHMKVLDIDNLFEQEGVMLEIIGVKKENIHKIVKRCAGLNMKLIKLLDANTPFDENGTKPVFYDVE